MLIGIDASRANRNHKSGVEWYSYYLIRWLAKLDSKNQYILYIDKPLRGGLLNLTTKQHIGSSEIIDEKIEYDEDGFQRIRSPHNNFKAKILKWPFNFLWSQGRLYLEMVFKKPDVLFIPAHTLPLIHPKKSIITIHDIGFKRNKRLYEDKQIGPKEKFGKKFVNLFVKIITMGRYSASSKDYLCWSTRSALKRAKKIITVSHFTKKELIDVYGAHIDKALLEEKIKAVHNGYNKYLYKKINNEEEVDKVLEKYDIKKPYLLYIGRLEKKKNTPALIEAFSIAREKNKNIKHRLVLVGDASFGYDEVKYMINEFDLEDEVIMPGWVEENDMPYLYSGAEAFVFPSLYEGFGIPIIQAMACEVPVIASDIASIAEIAGKAALLFNPKDVSAIAEAIERVVTDSELKNRLIENGKKQVNKFSWEKCAKETLNEIEKL